jgi:hypothetical protein
LCSVAGGLSEPDVMTTSNLLLAALFCVVFAAAATAAARALLPGARPRAEGPLALVLGVGTVRAVRDTDAGERQVTIDVQTAPGQLFAGQLRHCIGDPVIAALRPGNVVLVAFDPVAREHLSLPDDMLAVRSAFDQMLMRKGLTTAAHVDLIRNGIRSHGVITALRTTGVARDDHREVELDLMVSRPHGGQFPAHETALIHRAAVATVGPGSIIDTYYRPEDESAVAVCIPPR